MIDALVVTALSEAEVGSVSGGSGVSGWGDGMVDIKKEEMVVEITIMDVEEEEEEADLVLINQP